ncbi:hypothetical protein B0H14DRAFT_2652407 [Mycena olivaceomarginata]|nr:hypothetical protein B0H14DRAFT_2652407 [Mycena olivaceomarginata]
MVRGRPPLDPKLKEQRRRESVQRYKEKNRDKIREAAHLQMQRKEASDLVEWRARNTAKKRARKQEAEALRKKHKPVAELSPRQATKPSAKPAAKPVAEPLRRPVGSRAATSSTPTPAPRRGVKDAVVDHELIEDDSEEEHACRPVEGPIWPVHAARPKRCPHCYEEDCVGCACMCSASPNWIEHEGGHFFFACECKGQDCPGCALGLLLSAMAPGPILLCQPIYAPDPGHEDRWKHTGPFYAVVCRRWRGVVTSRETLARMKIQYPEALTWEAPSWIVRSTMSTWMKTHRPSPPRPQHPPPSPHRLRPQPALPAPVLPVPASPTKPSLKDRKKQRTEAHYKWLVAEDARIATENARAAEESSRAPDPSPSTEKLSKDDLAHLASFVNAPVSPMRLKQQLASVLGPHAVLTDPPPKITPIIASDNTSQEDPPPLVDISNDEAPPPLIDEGGRCATASNGPLPAFNPLNYGMSLRPTLNAHAHERPCQIKALLYAENGPNLLWKGLENGRHCIPRGAELLCTRDEEEAVSFLTDEVEAKMKKIVVVLEK